MLIFLAAIVSIMSCVMFLFGLMVLKEGEPLMSFIAIIGSILAFYGSALMFDSAEPNHHGQTQEQTAVKQAEKLCAPSLAHIVKAQDRKILLVTCGSNPDQHKITWK